MIVADESVDKAPLAQLFLGDRAKGTVLLWTLFFMSLLAAYFLISWLPLTLCLSGSTINAAMISAVVLNIGGVIGAIVWGRLMDRINPHAVLTAAYALAAVCILLIGLLDSHFQLLMAIVFVAGFSIIGGQVGINAVAANFYPTMMRATGIGLANGLGRLGSVIGPLIGGALMTSAVTKGSALAFGALPALVAACAVMLLGQMTSSRQPAGSCEQGR